MGATTPDWTPADGIAESQTPLNASINPSPSPPSGCSLRGPEWSWTIPQNDPNNPVQYSPDGSTWSEATSGYSARIVQPEPWYPAATLIVTYTVGGYWKFPCEIGAGQDDVPCGDTWVGFAIVTPKPKSVKLLSLKVVAGATQTNVIGATNWADVKLAGAVVTALASIQPDNQDAAAQIQWTNGSAVAGDATQRVVDKSISAMTPVTAQIGTDLYTVNIWIIWATVTIQISGNAAADNNCPELTGNGGNWDATYGGGNALGVKDHDSLPGLTYAYTIGQMQATCKLTPAGIGKVISTSVWKIKRTKESVGWDNGGHYTKKSDPTTWAGGPSLSNPAGTNDISQAFALDLDPTSGGSVDTIYDEDAPGCSSNLDGITIYRTSEYYGNFTQFVTVTLDLETTCSDNAVWSYQAQVDGDKAAGSRIDLNKLDTQLITIPNAPHYAQRN